jgi:Putative peptidase family
MFRNFPGSAGTVGSARRSFRLEEAWGDDTLSLQEDHVRRETAKVHVVRSSLSVAGLSCWLLN